MQFLSDCVFVFDLDDTLYKERDYVLSGREHVFSFIQSMFPDISSKLNELKKCPLDIDIWQEICDLLKLPVSLKESLLWTYRLHTPQIKLEPHIAVWLNELKKQVKALVILTDGRSVTQRLKLKALGLEDIEVYISEEWDSKKPDNKRFLAIEKKYPGAQPIYIADNVQKDFVTPNQLGWITLGLRDNGQNIHAQYLDNVSPDYLPNFWIDSLMEIEELFLRKILPTQAVD